MSDSDFIGFTTWFWYLEMQRSVKISSIIYDKIYTRN